MQIEAMVLGGDQHPAVERIDMVGRERQAPFGVGRQKAAQYRPIAREDQDRELRGAIQHRRGQEEIGAEQRSSKREAGNTQPPPAPIFSPAPRGPLGDGEGQIGSAEPAHFGRTVSLPIAVRPAVSGSYMSSTATAGYLNSPGVTAR